MVVVRMGLNTMTALFRVIKEERDADCIENFFNYAFYDDWKKRCTF